MSMTDKDAAIGRKVMVDELETINSYEAMADHASPEVAKVVRDIADEEKVHVGEAGAIIADHDKRALPAMEEGVKEARKIMKFEDMLRESIAKKDSEKGYPPLSEDRLMRDPYRHVELQVNDQVCMNANKGEHISSEGTMKQGDKNDGASGAYDEDNAPAKKDVKDDNTSGAYDGKSIAKTNGTGIENTANGIKYARGYGVAPSNPVESHRQTPVEPNEKLNVPTGDGDTEEVEITPQEQIDMSTPDSTKKSLPSFADMYANGVGLAFEKNCKRNLVEEMRKEYKEKKEKEEDAPEKTEKEESSDERVYFDDPDVDL